MIKLRGFIFSSIMYLYWSYLQSKNFASVNNILKIMNFLKNYILHFLTHIHAKDTNPTLICHCVYDDILQVPLVSTHFIFNCQLPNEIRVPMDLPLLFAIYT